jgi:hypothetical protein
MQQMCHPHMKAWLRGSMPCLPLVAMPMGIAVAGADTAYLAQQQNVTTDISGTTHGDGDN